MQAFLVKNAPFHYILVAINSRQYQRNPVGSQTDKNQENGTFHLERLNQVTHIQQNARAQKAR